MKVVAFIGSPRKNGNTNDVVQEILRGVQTKGADISVYYLNGMKIKGCQGCFYCRTYETCCMKDDMTAIYEEIKQAVYIIIGTPIYFQQIAGQTKVFLDRLYPLSAAHMKQFGYKKVIMVYSHATPALRAYEEYFDYTAEMMKSIGFQVVDTIVVNMAKKVGEAAKNEALMRKAFNLGKQMVSLVKTEQGSCQKNVSIG